jgi:formiminoglutamase
VLQALRSGHRCITLGGGHDYGYPDASAMLDAFADRPLIINFDAHLDVRDLSKGIGSGTPFYRMLEKYSPVDFVEIGLQNHCNSGAHVEYAKSKGVSMLRFDNWMASGLSLKDYVTHELRPLVQKGRKAFISLDIDVFASAFAPGNFGCSTFWCVRNSTGTGLGQHDFKAGGSTCS